MRRWIISGAVVATAVFGLVFALQSTNYGGAFASNIMNDISFALSPSAERAYTYASKHFNAAEQQTYDIDRAERFFEETLRLDPSHREARHELARIQFLRGDFEEALALIDQQLEEQSGEPPNSHYIRGLILSFMERYEEAAVSFETYLESDPNNWAALNDLAWVYLKLGKAEDAAYLAAHGLAVHPENPWLLNSLALALYDMGDKTTARDAIEAAAREAVGLTRADWLRAYPGNDPRVAQIGITAFQEAVADNMHRISLVSEAETSVE